MPLGGWGGGGGGVKGPRSNNMPRAPRNVNPTLLIKEHQKAVSTLDKGKSALAEHVCYTKHEIAWENSKVITTNNRYGIYGYMHLIGR